MNKLIAKRSLISVLIGQALSGHAFAANGGEIDGNVNDVRGKKPMASVVVRLRETGAQVTTQTDGTFKFTGLAAGNYTLALSLAGFPSMEQAVHVENDQVVRSDVAYGANVSAIQQVSILGQFSPASLARQAQKEAPNLISMMTSLEMKKLPDVNTGEAVRRLPGVSLETDEGEGRYVNIRGLDSDLNSTTFGGLRLPPTNNASPFGGYRAVTFDSIPSGLVGAITVTKTNLPEQDAEALGGTIEITPKTAPLNGKPFIQGNIGSGFESLRRTGIVDVSVSAGLRFGGAAPSDTTVESYGDRPFSVVATLAYYADKRGFDDVEPAYLDNSSNGPNAYSTIDQRFYQLHRRRHGYGIDFGYQPDATDSYYFRAFDAGHVETYLSNHLTITPDGQSTVLADGTYSDTLNKSGALQKSLRDEKETINDRVFVLGGKNEFDSKVLDYRLGFTKGSYDKPYDYNSAYTYAPANGATSAATIGYDNTGIDHTPSYKIGGTAANDYANPANYTLSGFRNSKAYNFDRELSVATNLLTPVQWLGLEDETFKFGGSIRLRTKGLSAQPYSYATLPALPLTAAAPGSGISYYKGQYENGPNIQPGYLQSQLGSGSIGPSDVINSAAQYLHAKEDVYAAYGQYQMTLGGLGVLAGLRVEETRDHANAIATVTDASGNTTLAPNSTSKSYSNFFPTIQGRYEISPKFLARVTFSSTIARPGFNQANPQLSIDSGAGIVARGNPDLKPIKSNNFDLSLERYLSDSGILSLGLFDKELDNYIVSNSTTETLPNTGLFAGFTGPARVVSYANAKKSHARGFEANYEQRFKQLPSYFGGLGAGFNWTYVDSRFEIRPGEFSSLPSTSRNTLNATLFYERDGVSLRLAAYHVSSDLFAIVGQGVDIYNSARTSLDFGSSYDFTKNLSVYFNAKNLTNTPNRFHEGSNPRVFQREFYGQTYQAGLRFDY